MKIGVFLHKPKLLEAAVKDVSALCASPVGEVRKHEFEDEKAVLTRVITQIRKHGIGEMQSLAFSFSTRELYIICAHLHELLSESGLEDKPLLVLKLRFRKGYLRIVHRLVQEFPYDSGIISFYHELLAQPNLATILDINEVLVPWLRGITRISPFPEAMASSIRNSNASITTAFERLKFGTGTRLYESVMRHVLTTAKTNDFENNPTHEWMAHVLGWPVAEQAMVFDRYCATLPLDHFETQWLKAIEKRYATPETSKNQYFWKRVSDEARKKYKIWFIGNIMDIFFSDNRRLVYWKKWLERVEDVWHVSSRQQLFLDFGSFGVIEFGETGNAAYFYEADVFRGELKSYANRNNSRSNTFLKHQDAMTKISHGGDWEYNMDFALNQRGIYGSARNG